MALNRLKIYRAMHHQNKGNAFQDALRAHGWHETQYRFSQYVQFGLFDADWRTGEIERLNGLPYFLYPHAARPMVQYDGCVRPRTDCRAMFVSAPAGVKLMKQIGYPCEVIEVGWSLTPIREFTPRKEARSILFAPIHPNANGYLSELDKNLNRSTYAVLSDYAEKHGSTIRVRFVRDITQNGLEKEMARADSNVIWQMATPDSSFDNILSADLVVAHQTFAYMAVALGVPCVMMGEDVPPRSGNTDEGFRFVNHFKDYKDLLQFPLDILDEDPEETIAMAIETDKVIKDWKADFIGKPFDGDLFVKCIEERL